MRKGGPETREAEILQQAVEKSIELSRAFSAFSRASTWRSTVELVEVLRAACVTKRTSFLEKGVIFDERVTPAVAAASVYGDQFLLESALSNILQNALEATATGGKVELRADIEPIRSHGAVAKIHVVDSGCGIAESNLEHVLTPFFSSKKDREGLGLSMAAPFVELHGGLLKISSVEGKGTEIEIALPTVHSSRLPDF